MQKINIKLVALGNLKIRVDFGLIEKWKSKVFQLQHADSIQLLPNPEISGWAYSDSQIASMIRPDGNCDFTVGIINAPLQQNYYVRRLGNNVAVLSIHEVADLLKASNLSIEKFVIRSLYGLCCYYEEFSRSLPPSDQQSRSHNETRGCVFDKTINKADIIFSTENPRLCESCNGRLMKLQISKDFLPSVHKELSKIKKDLYYRLSDFIKEHPVYSIVITTLVAVFIDTSGNYIYDLIKGYLPFL